MHACMQFNPCLEQHLMPLQMRQGVKNLQQFVSLTICMIRVLMVYSPLAMDGSVYCVNCNYYCAIVSAFSFSKQSLVISWFII